MGHMSGKVAIVTGASSGIGRATALSFAAAGARVVVASRRPDKSQETVELIRSGGGEALFIPTDVRDSADVARLVDATVDAYGRVDFACNNAGVLGNLAPTADASEENWDQVINTNLRGTWLCMKYEIRQMLKQGGGAIVNMSSVAGLVAMAGLPVYAAAKHGILGLTKTAALEYAKAGIRVNAICPAGVLTEMLDAFNVADQAVLEAFNAMHPIGRIGRPEDIGPAVVWLCSDQAAFITGQALPVDGGFIVQ